MSRTLSIGLVGLFLSLGLGLSGCASKGHHGHHAKCAHHKEGGCGHCGSKKDHKGCCDSKEGGCDVKDEGSSK